MNGAAAQRASEKLNSRANRCRSSGRLYRPAHCSGRHVERTAEDVTDSRQGLSAAIARRHAGDTKIDHFHSRALLIVYSGAEH